MVLNSFLDWSINGVTNITSGLEASIGDIDTSDDVQDVRLVITQKFFNRILDYNSYIGWDAFRCSLSIG